MKLADDFEAFWTQYPRRVGKLAAQKAYAKARRVASAEVILAGVDRYRAHMPDDAQYRPYPATWLNQGRWEDDYAEPVRARTRYDCPHDPPCNSKEWCLVLQERERA